MSHIESSNTVDGDSAGEVDHVQPKRSFRLPGCGCGIAASTDSEGHGCGGTLNHLKWTDVRDQVEAEMREVQDNIVTLKSLHQQRHDRRFQSEVRQLEEEIVNLADGIRSKFQTCAGSIKRIALVGQVGSPSKEVRNEILASMRMLAQEHQLHMKDFRSAEKEFIRVLREENVKSIIVELESDEISTSDESCDESHHREDGSFSDIKDGTPSDQDDTSVHPSAVNHESDGRGRSASDFALTSTGTNHPPPIAARVSSPSSASRRSVQSLLPTIGTDAICTITQYLCWNELVPFAQLNRLCAQILRQRHSAYYHPPLPSFQRMEFNLHTYQKWVDSRESLVFTSPEQLLAYSRSRIMTHATDIELHLDEYCQNPTSSPLDASGGTTIGPRSWFSASSSNVEFSLGHIRLALRRFTFVRSLRLWFRPTTFDAPNNDPRRAHRPCSCKSGTTFKNWFMKIAEMCLEEWAPKLVSFEWNIESSYRCIFPKDYLISYAARLVSLQHLGLFFPFSVYSQQYLAPHFLAAAFFLPANRDNSLVIFRGGYEMALVPAERREAITEECRSGATHLVWLRSYGLNNVFQALDRSQQLLTDDTTGPYQNRYRLDPLHLNPVRPLITPQRHQLRHLCLNPADWQNPMVLAEQYAYMKHLLALTVHNFTSEVCCNPSSTSALEPEMKADSAGLESLTIYDQFSLFEHADHGMSRESPVDYPSYLSHLRTQLRIFTFHSIINLSYSRAPPLPFDLIHLPFATWPYYDSRVAAELEDSRDLRVSYEAGLRESEPEPWLRLESLTLRFPRWEVLSDAMERPLTNEICNAMEVTFPKLVSLGLSIQLLPSSFIMNQSASSQLAWTGILTTIRELHLFGKNNHTVYFGRSILDYVPYRNFITTMISNIVIQMRQLESLHLHLTLSQASKAGRCSNWNKISFYQCLLPLTWSSANLRQVTIDFPAIVEGDLELFEEVHQPALFQLYTIWQLIQPSFQPPINYSSIRTFIYPLLSSRDRSIMDMVLSRLESRVAYFQERAESDSRLSVRIQKQMSEWKSQWKEWRHPDEVGGERARNTQVRRQRQANLYAEMCQQLQTEMNRLLQNPPYLNMPQQLTAQPRPFAFRLKPGNHEFDSNHEEENTYADMNQL